MRLRSVVIIAALSLVSCESSQQARGKRFGPGLAPAADDGLPLAPSAPAPDTDHDDGEHGTDPAAEYGLADIIETQAQLVTRFNRRPPVEGASVEGLKPGSSRVGSGAA